MNFVNPVVAVATILLMGCGQKGPLYLPEEPQIVVNEPAQVAQSSDITPDNDASQAQDAVDQEMSNE